MYVYTHVIISEAYSFESTQQHKFTQLWFCPLFLFVSSEINSCILNVFKSVRKILIWGVWNHVFSCAFFKNFSSEFVFYSVINFALSSHSCR